MSLKSIINQSSKAQGRHTNFRNDGQLREHIADDAKEEDGVEMLLFFVFFFVLRSKADKENGADFLQ